MRATIKILLVSLLISISGGVQAGDLGDYFGYTANYQLSALYSAAIRTESPADGNINAPPDPRIPIATFLKLPGSINSDDGDRNFRKYSLVNNRASLLGELKISDDDRGMIVRGDYFYDYTYRQSNDNNSPNTINKSGPVDEFTDAAKYYDGKRARLLDAYVWENFSIGDSVRGSVRVGQHVVAWGESLFFGGMALAQGPADGTKANLPGADVKSILLPVNQISLNASVGDNLTLMGLYKLAHKVTEINPVGEYFSITDAIGPGAQFAYGIYNPLYPDNLARANLTSKDLGEALETIGLLLGVPNNQALNISVPGGLPPLNLPVTGLVLQNASPYINVQYRGVEKPNSKYGQYGVGAKYQVLENTDVGLYYLRYHDTLPAPVFTYGYATLLPAGNGLPAVTTQAVNLLVPVSYVAKYFDGIHMTTATFSTTAFGANIAGEFIYRDGAIVLVDAQTAFGPIPTPSRAKTLQADLNALYIVGPAFFWDDITTVADIGFQHVQDFDPVTGPTGTQSRKLTYTRDSSAFSMLSFVNVRNVTNGWDLQIPIAASGMINGHSSLLAGFGGLVGEGDYRGSIGVNMTRAQALTIGLSYNKFFGKADYTERPFADRDYVAFNAKYTF